MYIRVIDIIGDRATDMQQGDKILNEIRSGLALSETVEVDFCDMQTVLSTFMNNAIGTLYQYYTSEFLNQYLKITNLCSDDMFILKRVIERAKDFYSNEKAITETLNDVL